MPGARRTSFTWCAWWPRSPIWRRRSRIGSRTSAPTSAQASMDPPSRRPSSRRRTSARPPSDCSRSRDARPRRRAPRPRASEGVLHRDVVLLERPRCDLVVGGYDPPISDQIHRNLKLLTIDLVVDEGLFRLLLKL